MQKMTYAGVVALTLALILAADARADGALEINHACVAAGCFSGDDPGFPVEVTAPGAYRLTGHIEVPNDATTAISLSLPTSSDKVVLDLDGFTISGPRSCTGTPVSGCTGASGSFPSGIHVSSGSRQARIMNGRIHGFYIGVNCRGCEILNMHLDNNSQSGVAASAFSDSVLAEGPVIRNSTLERNGVSGVNYAGMGTLIESSIFRFNKFHGIFSQQGSSVNSYETRGLVRFNVITDNGAGSSFGDELLYGNSFNESVSPPFSGGVSANTNNCNGTLC